MSDNHYRLDLSYDGAHFEGWQSQTSGRGVQDHIEKALLTILREPVRVHGASRTDSGVHALHQVAAFRTSKPVDLYRLQASLKGLLPPSIGIKQATLTSPTFHPIDDALGKAYRYRFWLDFRRHPFYEPFAWPIPISCDRSLMADAARHLVGRHDFSAFCAADSSAKTKERRIFEVAWQHDGPICDFWIIGEGFLKQMVRAIAGTLIDVGSGKRSPQSIPALLESKDRNLAGPTAPARGLTLMKVFYSKIESLDEIRQSLTW